MARTPDVFIADDDSEDRMIIEDLLKDLFDRSHIHLAESGMELLTNVERSLTDDMVPSLIILDLNMPKMNGMETLEKLRAKPALSSVPIVILSTSVNPKQKDACMLLGASQYFTKPCTYSETLQLGQTLHSIASGSA